MNNIIISADYNCDLPESILKEHSIRIIPFCIMINDARFQEYTEINYSMIRDYFENDNDKISSTPASVKEYRNHFLEIKESCEDAEIIHISVSGKLSDAYKNAFFAAKDMEGVYVVDSSLFSCAVGLLILKAAEMAENGMPAQRICDELLKIRNNISCSFALQITEYAAKNNRAGQTASYLLDLFKIKPIIKIKNNELKIAGVCMNNSTVHAKKYIKKVLGNNKKINEEILFIAISGCSDEFKHFVYNEVSKYTSWEQVYIQDVSATNFCNVGPESFGLMFYTN